jgi:outer membrane protein TolC
MRAAFVASLISLTRVADANPGTIEIEEAMAKAAGQHPITRESQADVQAAEARSDVERARFLPDVEVFAQLDRTTTNTSNGVLFPEPGIPVLSGTPGRTFGAGTWGSAVGATASWDVLGYRRWDAQIAAADREARVAREDAELTRLDVAYRAGDRFIVAVEHEEAIEAARAGVDRARVFFGVVKAAVDQNLRPGADLSRAQAELSRAETALIREESAERVSLEDFAEAFGSQRGAPRLVAGKLLDRAPPIDAAVQPSSGDPRVREAERAVDAAKARKDVVETGTQPRLALVGAIWARGGDDPGGIGADGLVPDVPNWTAAVVLTWPVLAGTLVRPQVRVEEARIARAESHVAEIVQHEQSQTARYAAILDAAYRVADKTPDTLQAARDAEAQSVARYQAKLATADDVAQAQRLLEEAEIDDAVARLEVWRALLGYAYARGDLSLFTILYDRAGR